MQDVMLVLITYISFYLYLVHASAGLVSFCERQCRKNLISDEGTVDRTSNYYSESISNLTKEHVKRFRKHLISFRSNG